MTEQNSINSITLDGPLKDLNPGLFCETCSARLVENEQCVICERLARLEQENLRLSKQNELVALERNSSLEKAIKLQMVIEDLSQRLYEQAQSFKQMNSGLREKERERAIWKTHATRQENRLRELKSMVRLLHDRGSLDTRHSDILLEVIDEPIDEPARQEEKVELPKQDVQTTTGGVDLTGHTIKIIHHALLEMSQLIDEEKIEDLCGSRDRGLFVDWMIGKSSSPD